LASFIDRVADYSAGRHRPAEGSTSRLSPHLHFGEIGPVQVLAALQESPVLRDRAEAFVRELGWREFANHLLYHFPHTADEPLDERFQFYPWQSSPEQLRAWQRGRTGIPLVDAGMRELWHSGWMHNRVRMIVASFLTKNLRIAWQTGARWFWDTLVDADLANNTLGWQWTAGCGADAAPYFRVFNPTLQAEKFDCAGEYVRRWIPELAPLPTKWLNQPWRAPAAVLEQAGIVLGHTYPQPIVDLKTSREYALEGFKQVQQAARLGEEVFSHRIHRKDPK
jgi:deoxyribodipyrimidine photo-lyase